MVGTAARILVSSVMFWVSSKGTFKSALTKTLLPFKSAPVRSPTLFLTMETAVLTGVRLVLRDRTLEATCRERKGSAAAPTKPRPRSGERRKWVDDSALTEDERERVMEEDDIVGIRDRDVGAAAEAIFPATEECV